MAPYERLAQSVPGDGDEPEELPGLADLGMPTFNRISLSVVAEPLLSADVSSEPKLPLTEELRFALVNAKNCIPEGLGDSKNKIRLEAKLSKINDLIFGEKGPFKDISPNGDLQLLVENADFCRKFEDCMKGLGAVFGDDDLTTPRDQESEAKPKRSRTFYTGFAHYLDKKKGSLSEGQYVPPNYVKIAYKKHIHPAYLKLVEFKQRFDAACKLNEKKALMSSRRTRVISQVVPNPKLAELEERIVSPVKAGVVLMEDIPEGHDTQGLKLVAPNVAVDELTGKNIKLSGQESFRPTKPSFEIDGIEEEATMVVTHFMVPEGDFKIKNAEREVRALQKDIFNLLGGTLLKVQSLNSNGSPLPLPIIENVRSVALFLMQLDVNDTDEGWNTQYPQLFGEGWQNVDPRILRDQIGQLIVNVTDYLQDILGDVMLRTLDFRPKNIAHRLQELRIAVRKIASLYEALERTSSESESGNIEQQKDALLTFCSMELPCLIGRINNFVSRKAQMRMITGSFAVGEDLLTSQGVAAPVAPSVLPLVVSLQERVLVEPDQDIYVDLSAKQAVRPLSSSAVVYETVLGQGALNFAHFQQEVAMELQEGSSSVETTPDVLSLLKPLIAQGVAALKSTDESEEVAQKREVALVG
ncbi:MAG: hypothetical protein WCW30_02305, partial [Candidatus Gracilibacteria bacterium]